MKPEEFCYWLQGFLEMSDAKTMNAKQVASLKAHLALVFEHAIDPSYVAHLPPKDRAARMEQLQNLHDGEELDEDDDDDEVAPASPAAPPPGVQRIVDSLRRPRFDPNTRYKC